jgi:hypothetical protein
MRVPVPMRLAGGICTDDPDQPARRSSVLIHPPGFGG